MNPTVGLVFLGGGALASAAENRGPSLDTAASKQLNRSLPRTVSLSLHWSQTISLIMRKVLIAISNSATISSEGLIAELHNVWSYENTTMRRANSDY